MILGLMNPSVSTHADNDKEKSLQTNKIHQKVG